MENKWNFKNEIFNLKYYKKSYSLKNLKFEKKWFVVMSVEKQTLQRIVSYS